MKREKLIAEKRTILGKRVKHLRRQGILPANIFGHGMNSISLQLPLKEFVVVYKIAHETGLVDLSVDGTIYPVLIQNVHFQPATHNPLHADFFKVNLKEKTKVSIPIIGIGEPKAVTEKIGVLLQPLSEVEIEALPADLPENLEVNIENLANIDDSIAISGIKAPNGVEIMAEPNEIVFRIGELVSEEAEELEAEEESEAEAASESADNEAATDDNKSENSEGDKAKETSEE